MLDERSTVQMDVMLDNIESAVTHLKDGDLLTFTIPDGIPMQVIDRFMAHLAPRIDEVRVQTGRRFGVLVLTGGLEVELVKGDRDYNRLRTELEEVKQTLAKLLK